ncbi:hypothetical protein RYX36_015350 [Vicia faba]
MPESETSAYNQAKDKADVSETFVLNQNFRTHSGVLALSQRTIELLSSYFPHSIDVLKPETSLIYGEAPVVLDCGSRNDVVTIFGNTGHDGGKFVGFGAEQVILVRDDNARKEILNSIGKQALVLTVLECKGLEFQRCGEIELCLGFFRRMVESNGIEIRVQSLTLVIDGLCKRGEVEKAKELMDEMVTKSIVKPTVFTYNTLLNAYVGRKDRSGVGEILRLMEKEPVVFSVATYSILIQWYSSSGDIGEVEKIFEEMRERKIEIDVYVYSSMISWNCRLGNMKRAFALFDEMAQRNVAPNAHTYGALIGGVCKAGQMEAAEILLEEMQSKGIDLNMIIFNTMIDGYCKRGMMDEALRLQTIMERKGFNADVFTFNILANGLCKLHRYDEAKCTLNSMVDTSGTSLGSKYMLDTSGTYSFFIC